AAAAELIRLQQFLWIVESLWRNAERASGPAAPDTTTISICRRTGMRMTGGRPIVHLWFYLLGPAVVLRIDHALHFNHADPLAVAGFGVYQVSAHALSRRRRGYVAMVVKKSRLPLLPQTPVLRQGMGGFIFR